MVVGDLLFAAVPADVRVHRAYLAHRPVADHHPAGVYSQVPREVLELTGELQHRQRDVMVIIVHSGLEWAPPVDLLAPGVLLARRVTQRLGHVPDRGPG